MVVHSLADHALTYALNLGFLYRDGFGDRAALAHIVRSIETFTTARPAGDVVMRYAAGPARSVRGGEARLATFASPAPTPIPVECRTARVQIWKPTQDASGPMCILLAATGDEGFRWREALARRLLADGIGSVILENPFYGSRRPRGQRGPALRTVLDKFAMNTAMVDEARDFPVVVVPRAAGAPAALVLTEWALSRTFHWPSLAREAGSIAEARAELARHLSVVDLTRFAAPVAPELATVLVVRHDIASSRRARGGALHRHWPGLVVSNAGHVSSALLEGDAHVRAVVGAFRRAGAREPRENAAIVTTVASPRMRIVCTSTSNAFS